MKDISTKVSAKAQRAYKNKCKELGLVYKPLADSPQTLRMQDGVLHLRVDFARDSA